jgi:hypothetical protein
MAQAVQNTDIWGRIRTLDFETVGFLESTLEVGNLEVPMWLLLRLGRLILVWDAHLIPVVRLDRRPDKHRK